jgi:hypothetical protein
MLSPGWMIAKACAFGVIIWLDENIDVIIWLNAITFPSPFVLSSV